VEAALLAMKKFDFDTILFPINFNCWNNGDFGPQVYDVARSKGMGILALKAMALTTLGEGEKKLYKNVWYRPIQDDKIARLALRYTLSKELTAAIPPGDAEFFWKAVDVARNFKPISTAENETLAKLANGLKPVFSHELA
jgi:predicted aldo/keto reductase-like oxidoreductase